MSPPTCVHLFLNHRKIIFAFLLLFNLAVWIVRYEETNYGSLINWYGNFYRQIVYRPIHARRSDLSAADHHRLNISVVVVVDISDQLLTEYQVAHQTLICYCTLHAYQLVVIEMQKWHHRSECPQEDFMFRRHCAVAKWLSMSPSVQYALFLDADMGVINPDHLLENYLAKFEEMNSPHNGAFDMIFYERIFNGEIMAGSYWARNTAFTIEMLHFWANFRAVFLELICGHQCSDLGARCLEMWADARNFGELRTFELCVHAILGVQQQFHINFGQSAGLKLMGAANDSVRSGRVLLVTNFRHYWSRVLLLYQDGWLTGNQWSSRDFIVHGWQSRRLDQPTFARWHSPLVLASLNRFLPMSSNCSDPKIASLHWPYKESFMRAALEIDAKIGAIVSQRRQDDLNLLASILI